MLQQPSCTPNSPLQTTPNNIYLSHAPVLTLPSMTTMSFGRPNKPFKTPTPSSITTSMSQRNVHGTMHTMTTNIVWWVLHIAINRFTASEQQVPQKFIHGWLPLQTQPQVTSTSTNKLCLSCKWQPEDMAHFLSCPHSLRTILLQPLQLQLQKLHHKHKVNPMLYQLPWQGLTSVLLSHKLPSPDKNYQDTYLQIYTSQGQHWMAANAEWMVCKGVDTGHWSTGN